MDFAPFDKRRYPTLSVSEGYGEWAETYEDIVLDNMDLRLLERVESLAWHEVGKAVDLACGTGRTGAWLKKQGVRSLHGIDLTQQMLARAERKGLYDALDIADLRDTGLPSSAYDLAAVVLADEHIENLMPLYREAARLTKPGGCLVLVGYHPHFIMKGIPTHFDRRTGESVAIATYLHLFSDHVKAAGLAGYQLAEMHESIVDDAWIAQKPKWAKYRNEPVSFCLVWMKKER